MRHTQATFDISDAARALGLTAVCFTMSNVRNRSTDPQFEALRAQVTQQVLTDLSREKIEHDPILLGFRQLHQTVGRANSRHVASPETLLRGLLRTGRLSQVSLLVDIYNLISIKTRLSLGAHDLTAIRGGVHLRLTNGNERFWPLGAQRPQPVEAGEYAYIDDENDLLCRLEIRQCDKTKITLDTTECFYIVQGNPATDDAYLRAAAEELITLITRFCGGQAQLLATQTSTQHQASPGPHFKT